jgi:ABC-type multidrug transport system ATPase subunit
MKQGNIIADSNPAQLAGSIKIAHIHLFITQGREQLLALLNERQLMHSIDENLISIAIEEHDIAAFLSTLAQQNLCYATISIDKATLEDYFLSVSS